MEQQAETDTPKWETSGEVAQNLSFELLGYGQGPVSGQRSDKWPLAKDKALLSDTAGLLGGIADGYITTGQPRIRDNLMLLIDSVPEQPSSSIGDGLRQILYLATRHGLTADNQPLHAASRSRFPAR